MSTSAAIDRIVANVLQQLRSPSETVAPAAAARSGSAPREHAQQERVLSESVITAELLSSLPREAQVRVSPRAIITPAGWDAIRERGLKIQKVQPTLPVESSGPGSPATSHTKSSPAEPLRGLLILGETPAGIASLWPELQGGWSRELLGNTGEAAQLAISAVCRGDAERAVIVTPQPARAACLANRNDRVFAVAVAHPGEVRSARRQMSPNVFCVEPSPRSDFEWKALFREISGCGSLRVRPVPLERTGP